jgi:hypothetical protein
MPGENHGVCRDIIVAPEKPREIIRISAELLR